MNVCKYMNTRAGFYDLKVMINIHVKYSYAFSSIPFHFNLDLV